MIDKQLSTPEAVPSVQPFHALVYPITLLQARRISERYAQRALSVARTLGLPPFPHDHLRTAAGAPGQPRLRLGYVSSDFGNHPLAHLMCNVFG